MVSAVKEDKMRIMPQNIDAEEAVLGAIFVNPESISKIIEIIREPKSFYKPAHQYIYEVMLKLFNKNEKIDIISVSEELSYMSKLELVGGREFINELSYNAITSANIVYYAKIIQEKAIKRALINAGSEIVSLGYELESIDSSLDNAERLIFDISSKKTTTDLIQVKDLVLDTYEKIEYRYNHRDELTGIDTGFYDFNTLTSGLQKSDLIILAARPSMGKTALALNIAQNVAIRSKVPVAVFSLEMSKEQLVQRMLCSEAEVDTQRLKSGHMQSKDWEKLAGAMNDFADAPIYIDDSAGVTLTDIRAKARRLAMVENGLGLIIVDYLQLIESTGKEERFQAVSTISRGLKTLARELNIPVIALSQLSRKVEERGDKRPMLSDLRESGAIEQDADIVMFIYREDYYSKGEAGDDVPKATGKEGKSEIIIAKHRNGPVGSFDLLFQGNITKFKSPIKTDVF